MRKKLKIFIVLIILVAGLYQFRDTSVLRHFGKLSTRQAQDKLSSVRDTISSLFVEGPCEKPIPYDLDIFDSRFNISKSYFLTALLEAEAIWEKPSGLDLFAYTPLDPKTDVLKINLIYDYRQEATSKLASIGITVKNTRASYNMLESKFILLKTEYARAQDSYSIRIEDFNQRNKAYDVAVNFWNKTGGAPRAEYDRLGRDRLVLEKELKELQKLQINLTEMVDEINAVVVVLNRLVTSLDLSVEKYNTVSVSRGESFEEGIFSDDGENQVISIYEFSNKEKLVRVLAHELGHALGLGHVEDEKAIMYKFNHDNSLTLSEADLSELGVRCDN